MGDRQRFSEGAQLFLLPPRNNCQPYLWQGCNIYKMWGYFNTTPFYVPKIAVKHHKLFQIGHIEIVKITKFGGVWRLYEHQILFLLPSRLLYFLFRGGTCPHGPYRLIAYG